ncbi:MAG: hypothetical protein KJZ70_10515 [Bryobacterales bacterium]|nr:hypothetical protein [Bryobacterales bacterium]
MATWTQDRISDFAPVGRELGERPPEPGIDPRIARLEAGRNGLWEALRVPGAEGQGGIFARLEDMKEALDSMRRELNAALADSGTADGSRGGASDRRAEWERNRVRVAEAIWRCQETLRRVDQVFSFMGGMIEDRVGQTSGDAYRFARPGWERRPPAHGEGVGGWEG